MQVLAAVRWLDIPAALLRTHFSPISLAVSEARLSISAGAARATSYFTISRLLLFAEDDFALADELIVEPEAVFVGGGL